MLSRAHRLHRSQDFREVVRSGARAGSRSLVVHLVPPAATDETGEPEPARMGFIVSKSVGPAVARNRVKRRLRHACRELLPQVEPGARVVVRALPAAGEASGAELSADLLRCVRRASRPRAARSGSSDRRAAR